MCSRILEILRLLYRGADVLILDEPTAVLAPPLQIVELPRSLCGKLKRRTGARSFSSVTKLEEVLEVLRRHYRDACRPRRRKYDGGDDQALKRWRAPWSADNVPAPRIWIAQLRDRRSPRIDPRRRCPGSRLDLSCSSRWISIFAGARSSASRALEGTDRTNWSNARQEFCLLSPASFVSPAWTLTNASAASFRRAESRLRQRRSPSRRSLSRRTAVTDNFVIAGREHGAAAFSRLGFLRGANIRSEAESRAFERLGVRYGVEEIPPAISLRRQPAASCDLPRTFAGVNSSWSLQPTRGVDIAGSAFIHNCDRCVS